MLEIKNLCKNFGSNPVLNNINFCVKKGEVVVILGPSGCGKSTLLRCINGLESTNSGEIIFQHKIINKPKTNWRSIRSKIGMVFQSYELFPHLSVLENITLAPIKVEGMAKNQAQNNAKRLLARFNLGDKITSMPRELSGGQKQRVAIIRALCMNPEIMLFDEVTASLDPEMAFEVSSLINELASDGMTMLIVTHELKFARKIADKIIFMQNGMIVESALGSEFFNAPKSELARKFLNIFG